MQNPPGKQCRHKSSAIGELILENAVTSTDQQLVCTMAMVCRDWNMDVQHQAPPGLLHVTLHKGLNDWRPQADALPSSSMKKLGSFCKWLPKHARLVSKLEVTGQLPHRDDDRAWFSAHAAPLFSLALQSAGLATAAQAACKTTQVQRLGMQSYTSDIFHDSTVLQALPSASLTHLQLTDSSVAAVAAALPCLSNLQHLDIARGVGTTIHCGSGMCAAVGQVPTLTSLKLGWVTAEDVTQLPVHLSRLELRLWDDDPVDMSHLTRLSSLNMSSSYTSPSLGQVLPAGLAELIIPGDAIHRVSSRPSILERYNILQLQSLESLAIVGSNETSEDLHKLGALPALQKLSLGYTDAVEAFVASFAWASLWQLKDIELLCYHCYVADLVELLDKLGSVTQLTRLAMDFDLGIEQPERVYDNRIWRRICGLHQLQDLTIRVHNCPRDRLAWGGVNHLSTLTQLTKLELSIVGFAHKVIDDLAAVELLLEMKQLQELRVPVKGLAVFPVIGDLSNLRALDLYDVPAEVQQIGLHELQGLKRLTELRVLVLAASKH